MTNKHNTVLYTGVTSNLVQRAYQHQTKTIQGFTSTYNVTKLVYYETTDSAAGAIAREKQIKAGSRKKKITLIQQMNPQWRDLSNDLQ